MKRSLKTHSASLKSSKSRAFILVLSSKILSFCPSADLYSWPDFLCAVLWLVDALLCKMSVFDAALERKWSKKSQIPSPWSIPVFSPMAFPKWKVSFAISCFSERVWCLMCWEWGSWELSCLESCVDGEQSQHAALLCYCVHMFWGFLSLLQVNHLLNGTGNFLSAWELLHCR